MAKLEIEITGNIDGFKKAVEGATKVGERLSNPFKNTEGIINTLNQRAAILKKNLEGATDIKSIAQYNRRLEDTKNELERIKGLGTSSLTNFGNAAQRTSNQVQRLGQATSGYNSIGIEFSRIIQDAPFGIMGIGNNITQLAGNFQQLRNQSTSTGAALKTAISSIISPSNLLVLGISVLTTVLTVLSQKGFFKSKESAEDAATALENYRKKLTDVTKAGIEGADQGFKEAESFRLLRAQAENANVPLNKRLEAVRDLKSEFPEYLSDLTDEQILTGQVGGAYDILTKSIVATAKARAFSGEIAKNSLDLLTIENQEIERSAKILSARDKLASIGDSKRLATGQDLLALKNQESIQQQIINDLVKEQVDSANSRGVIIQENLDLEKQINNELANGASFTKETVIPGLETENEAVQKILRSYEQIANIKVSRPEIGGPSPEIPGVSARPEVEGESLAEFFERISGQFGAFGGDFLGTVEQFTSNLNNLIGTNMIAAFSGIGDAIGQAFATGENVFSALGQSLLDSISSFLGDLGQQLIAFGVAGIAFGSLMEAIKKGGPLSIPAGLGAIAAGTALIAISSAIKNRAGQGLEGGTSGVGSGAQSQSFTGSGAFTDPSSMFSNVTFEIAGDKLIGVIDRTQDRYAKG